MKESPIILVTNDDGIFAPGIHRLVECMPDNARIFVVAPEAPHSGQSSAITVKEALRIKKCEEYCTDRVQAFSVNGTPVDCVKLAMHTILPSFPDLAVSGINHGSNAGNSIIYSGTMGSVLETCTLGIPSIGYSLLDHSMKADFTPCMPFVKSMAEKVLENGLPARVCLNVNFPKTSDIKGYKIVAAAKSHWTDEYVEYVDPQGKKFYMLTGELINDEPENPGTDLYWLHQDYASVVPATPDQTQVDAIPEIMKLLD